MCENEFSKPPSPEEFALVISSEREMQELRKACLLVIIHGLAVRICYGSFILLLRLVRARGETCTGYLGISQGDTPENFRLGIYRLRRELDRNLGSNAGHQLIQTGVCTEYRLGIEAASIALDRSFRELPRHLVPEDLHNFLIENFPEVEINNLHDMKEQL